jgi:hypothetical protein
VYNTLFTLPCEIQNKNVKNQKVTKSEGEAILKINEKTHIKDRIEVIRILNLIKATILKKVQ